MDKVLKTDFITIADHSREWIDEVFEISKDIKQKLRSGESYCPLIGKTMGMIFEKPSARTRISFEVGMYQLGGYAVYLSPNDIQMGKRESVEDIARVLSRYYDVIMARLFKHSVALTLAEYASVPVINGLTDLSHPCQILADAFTIIEKKGTFEGLRIAFVGDGNNVANSWINLASKFDFNFILACPEGYEPDKEVLENAKKCKVGKVEVIHDPVEAVRNADVLYSDVWASMGQEDEKENRMKAFREFQLNSKLISHAKKDHLVLHCLPAHRGEEITDEIIDGKNSVVFDEAENRMHAQKGLLVKLLR